MLSIMYRSLWKCRRFKDMQVFFPEHKQCSCRSFLPAEKSFIYFSCIHDGFRLLSCFRFHCIHTMYSGVRWQKKVADLLRGGPWLFRRYYFGKNGGALWTPGPNRGAQAPRRYATDHVRLTIIVRVVWICLLCWDSNEIEFYHYSWCNKRLKNLEILKFLFFFKQTGLLSPQISFAFISVPTVCK